MGEDSIVFWVARWMLVPPRGTADLGVGAALKRKGWIHFSSVHHSLPWL